MPHPLVRKESYEEYESPSLISGGGNEGEDVRYVSEGPLERIKEIIDKIKEILEPVIRQAKEKGIPFAKENCRMIAAAAAALVVVYILYWFFIGSVASIELRVADTEGAPISAASVAVYPKGSQAQVDSFTGSKTISMRFGDYEVDVSASGYKALGRYLFTIAPGASVHEFVLEQAKDIEIGIDFPDKLYTGETREITASIKNKGSESAEVELVAEGDLAKDSELSMGAVQVPPGSTTEATFSITVDEDAKAAARRSGSIRVKGLNEKVSADYQLIEFVSSDLKVDKTALDFGTLDAGEGGEKTIKITSSADFDIENIMFAVTNVSARKNNVGEVAGWFNFNPPQIDALEKGTTNAKNVAINVEVPLNAQTDTIDALVEVYTTFWKRTINVDLDIKGISAELELLNFDKSYNIIKTGSEYDEVVDLITIKNSGEVDIEDIKMAVSNCTADFVEISSDIATTGIDILAGQQATVALTVSAPGTFLKDKTRICPLRVVYTDPRNPLQELQINETIIINS